MIINTMDPQASQTLAKDQRLRALADKRTKLTSKEQTELDPATKAIIRGLQQKSTSKDQ